MELEQQLIQAAVEGMHNALTKNMQPEDTRFGAAVLTTNDHMYQSGAYFSDTYSLTLHAEQAALAHAAAHGEYNIKAIAVIGNYIDPSTPIVYPCHMCKQLLWENYLRSSIDFEVILLSPQAKVVERHKISEMIHFPWPGKK